MVSATVNKYKILSPAVFFVTGLLMLQHSSLLCPIFQIILARLYFNAGCQYQRLQTLSA
jgi:hypothetical protein